MLKPGSGMKMLNKNLILLCIIVFLMNFYSCSSFRITLPFPRPSTPRSAPIILDQIDQKKLADSYITGFLLYHAGDYENALQPLLQFIELDPHNNRSEFRSTDSIKMYAQAFADLGFIEQTYWACKEGLKYSPDDSDFIGWLRWYESPDIYTTVMPRICPVSIILPGNRGPRPVFVNFPEFPESEKKKKIKGYINLSILINEEGRVTEIQVIENTTGSTVLENVFIEAAMQDRYLPAFKESVPVKIWIKKQLSFQS